MKKYVSNTYCKSDILFGFFKEICVCFHDRTYSVSLSSSENCFKYSLSSITVSSNITLIEIFVHINEVHILSAHLFLAVMYSCSER